REVAIDDNVAGGTVESIVWSVRVANRKASFYRFASNRGEDRAPDDRRNLGAERRKLDVELAGGVKEIGGKRQRGADLATTHVLVKGRGAARADRPGRLLLWGGRGRSGSWSTSPRLDYSCTMRTWVDDVCAGPIGARRRLRGVSRPLRGVPAWVIVGPPRFAQ